jgi:hypothetical protein
LRESLARQMVSLIRRIRAMDLRKAPSISETLDWAQALVLLNAEQLNRELVEETLQLILKYDRDVQQVSAQLPMLLEGANGAARLTFDNMDLREQQERYRINERAYFSSRREE